MRDPGLQPERTVLAWRRTALAAGVAGALALRATVHCGLTALVAVTTLVVAAALWRSRAGSPRDVAVAAVLCGWLSAVSAAVVWFSR